MDQNLKRIRFLLKGLDASRFPIKLEPSIKARPNLSYFERAYEWKFITHSDIGYVTTHEVSNGNKDFAGAPISVFDKETRKLFLDRLETYLEKEV